MNEVILRNKGKLFKTWLIMWFNECKFYRLDFLFVLVFVPLFFLSKFLPPSTKKLSWFKTFISPQLRLRFVALSLWPTFIFSAGQCVKRSGRHELLRRSCTCIPDIPCVYHLLAGASLGPERTHGGEQTGCSPHRNEQMPPIHDQL